MIKKTLALVALSATLFAGSANNKPTSSVITVVDVAKAYVSVGASAMSLQRDYALDTSVNTEDITYGLTVKAGYDFLPYLGLEVRGTHAKMESLFSEKTSYGIYLKPQYNIDAKRHVYGLLGYAQTDIDIDTRAEGKISESYKGFSYGGGYECDFGEPNGWTGFIDFVKPVSAKGPLNSDSSILTIGVNYRF